jgi:hypothetical protein
VSERSRISMRTPLVPSRGMDSRVIIVGSVFVGVPNVDLRAPQSHCVPVETLFPN